MPYWLFLSLNTILQPLGWTLGLTRQTVLVGRENGWGVYRPGPQRLSFHRFPRRSRRA